MKTVKVLWSLCLSVVVLIAYQNCGEGFEAATGGIGSLSSQCKATIQANFAALDVDVSEVNCEDASAYACELRVFKPGVVDSLELRNEAIGSYEVLTDIRSFDTSGARSVASVDAGEFAEGGEYNRVEATCHHSNTYRGVATFVGSSDDLKKAFEQARGSCLAAKRGGS